MTFTAPAAPQRRDGASAISRVTEWWSLGAPEAFASVVPGLRRLVASPPAPAADERRLIPAAARVARLCRPPLALARGARFLSAAELATPLTHSLAEASSEAS